MQRLVQGSDLTIILVSYKTRHLLEEVIGCVYQGSKALSVQTIVVDNASNDGSVELIKRQFADCQLVVNQRNLGFGRANNGVLGLAQGRYVLLLNSDAFVSPDTLDKTGAYMDTHPRCGILGRSGLSRLFRQVRMVDDMNWDQASVRQCDWVPGCYYLVRRQVIDQIGLFDLRYFLYYEEVDHCLAAKRAGWDVVFYPHTTVIHVGGESAKSDGEITQSGRQLEALQVESELLYFRKNHGVAGVWMNVLVTTLADAIIVLKRLLKKRSPVGFGVYAKHCALVWSLLSRTRWGMRPTR